MAKRHRIYECVSCKNVVEVYGGDCGLICCEEPMEHRKQKHASTIKIVDYSQKTENPADFIEAEALF